MSISRPPRRTAVRRSCELHRGGRPAKGVPLAAEKTTGHVVDGDPDRAVLGSGRRPARRRFAAPAEAGEVIGQVTGGAVHDDAPPGVGAFVEHVDFEHDRMLDDVVDLGSGIGAKHDHVLEGRVVDDADDRVGGSNDEPTDVLGAQEGHTCRAIELEHLGGSAGVVHEHSSRARVTSVLVVRRGRRRWTSTRAPRALVGCPRTGFRLRVPRPSLVRGGISAPHVSCSGQVRRDAGSVPGPRAGGSLDAPCLRRRPRPPARELPPRPRRSRDGRRRSRRVARRMSTVEDA